MGFLSLARSNPEELGADCSGICKTESEVNGATSKSTAAWLGHSTVLINFFGINILTDPVLFPRIGIRIPFLFTIGPKRLTEPALRVDELPRIDFILLSHAHFDHIDWRTLNHLSRGGARRRNSLPRRERAI